MSNIEEKLRRLSVKQLEALATFIPTGEQTGDFTTVSRVSNSIHTADDENKDRAAGGILSSLAKIKTENGPLILAAGRDTESNDGLRWILNPKVISRDELREVLNTIPGIEI